MSSTIRFGVLAFSVYVACILGANLLIATFPPTPVGFGLFAPAGVWLAGLTFSFRNLVQQTLGRRFGFLAIVLGAALSALLAPGINLGGPLPLPLASGVAFLASESMDALVWTRLRERGWWVRAMGAGDAVGQIADSALFLLLAFGSVDLLLGQLLGKQYSIWPVLFLMVLWKQHRSLPINPVLRKVEV